MNELSDLVKIVSILTKENIEQIKKSQLDDFMHVEFRIRLSNGKKNYYCFLIKKSDSDYQKITELINNARIGYKI